MEIYCPTMIEKCKKKLQQFEPKKFSMKNSFCLKLPQKFIALPDRDDIKIKNQNLPIDLRVVEAIHAQDLDTDDEMKNIKLDDINSDANSSDYGSEENKKVSKGYEEYMAVLSKVQRPLQYYQKINKTKPKYDEEKILQDFDPNSPVFSSEYFEKKEI